MVSAINQTGRIIKTTDATLTVGSEGLIGIERSTLGIPQSAEILSCQLANITGSTGVVLGFGTDGTKLYIGLQQPVQVNNSVIRIIYAVGE